MGDLKKLLKIFSRDHQPAAPESATEAFKIKYHAFQTLLEKNNQVLELMADMEEKMSGEYLFDRHYIDANWRLISDNVLRIIENLNILSKNRYSQLYKPHDEINKDIEQFLSIKLQIPVSDFTISLEELKGEMSNIAGGKMAHLGEIKSYLDLSTPDGFAVTAYSFKRFMEHNKFSEKINENLSSIGIENLEEIEQVSREIQDMVIQAEIPEDVEKAIKKAVEGLKAKLENNSPSNPPVKIRGGRGSYDSVGGEGELRVSVRSSAIQEDGEFSFAGQYATFLNVSEDLILQKYKEVIASLFKARAIYYYKTKGFSEEEMVMAAGILRMIDAMSAGVIYTRDPNAPERNSLIINAIWGLGKPVVDGSLEPDSYIVSREDGTVLQKRIVEKKTMLICSNKGDTEEISVPDEIRHKPCLTNEQIKALLKAAMFLENYYGSPQDIEWAINKNNKLFILQTRPLRIFNIQYSRFKIPRKVEGCNILIDKGVIACRGIGYGKAFILKDEDELKKFPDGAILVARQASTKFVTIMNKASAIITDIGCATEHMASISREYQVPTILDSKIATSIIKDGHEITVDAINCNVYEGRVNELLIYKPQGSTFKDTHLFKTMQQILRWITPLNLTDPADENFKPEYCKTFHDITRFAHEMAMAEMFSIGEEYDTRGLQTVALKSGIPVDVVMMDIDGGIKEKVKKASPEDILSIPFSAFLKGMLSMRWHEPKTADAKGFFHIMATTASMPEDQLRQIGTKSFAIISKNYMNFSIRLGYHFSQVEAYTGDKMNDNYIRFFFKGGGSSPDRKLRRVRLIKEILKSMDIRNVSVKEDMINAVLIGYNRSIIEEKLAIIGKLTAYTKQLDMVMYNDAVTDWHIEEFVKEHMKGSE